MLYLLQKPLNVLMIRRSVSTGGRIYPQCFNLPDLIIKETEGMPLTVIAIKVFNLQLRTL